MSLQRHKAEWEELAQVDPMWAISSTPTLRYGKWDTDEFFATGRRQIEAVLARCAELGLPQSHERALDFGCGVGRLTRAMAPDFKECIGVDISGEMLSRARELNADRTNCKFVLNDSPDLRQFPSHSFDFICTVLVLQHLPSPAIARRYIAEFLRVLKPGGILVFQLPYYIPWRNRLQLRRRLYAGLRRIGLSHDLLYKRAGLHPIRMISLSRDEVRDLVESRGGEIVNTVSLDSPEEPIKALVYFVRLRERGGDGAKPLEPVEPVDSRR